MVNVEWIFSSVIMVFIARFVMLGSLGKAVVGVDERSGSLQWKLRSQVLFKRQLLNKALKCIQQLGHWQPRKVLWTLNAPVPVPLPALWLAAFSPPSWMSYPHPFWGGGAQKECEIDNLLLQLFSLSLSPRVKWFLAFKDSSLLFTYLKNL